MPNLRETYPLNSAVRLSDLGRRVPRQDLKDRRGQIVGYCRDGDVVSVLWDGLKTPQAWHRDYVERVDA